MTATGIKEHTYNLTTNEKGEKCVKVASIYGANASGKTSVIDAFRFMHYFVINSFKRSDENINIPIKRFAFDKSSRNKVAEFEVFFFHKDKEYQYGFTLDNKRVHQEWLYKRDFRGKDKYNTLFERNENKIECDTAIKDAKKFIDLVEEPTLFLSMIANAKIKEAKTVYEWFVKSQVLDFGDAFMEEVITKVTSKLLSHESFKEEDHLDNLEKFLKAIDIGIEGIRVEKRKNTISEDKPPNYDIYSQHKTIDGNSIVEIPFSEESSGTRKMYCLYMFLLQCFKKRGSFVY